MPHNLAITDSSLVEYKNVTNIGFTICGLYNSASITVDSCNEIGEFIVADSVSINFSNARTVLLWHLVDKGKTINFSFPNGDNISSFSLNDSISGMYNIKYNIWLENCTGVMWSLMPKAGSEINIKNPKIRSIGVWFNGSDTSNVSGLVNNSIYTSFNAPLKDRILKFENSEVRTWSIYTFDRTVVNIQGCLLGEVGAVGRSSVVGQNYLVDGSGGYLFVSDTALMINSFSSATSNVRSERYGLMLFGYSAQTNGIPVAIRNSILILVQSALIEKPSISDGAVVWFAKIDAPSLAYISESNIISGSAWIDKTQTSFLMDFKKYVLSYRRNGDSNSTKIGDTIFSEVRDDILGSWDTRNLQPGNYNLKLTLISDIPNEFGVEAIKQVNLLPKISSVGSPHKPDFISIFTNPASDYIEISGLNLAPVLAIGVGEWVRIFNTLGKCVKAVPLEPPLPKRGIEIDVSTLPKAIYFIQVGNEAIIFIKE